MSRNVEAEVTTLDWCCFFLFFFFSFSFTPRILITHTCFRKFCGVILFCLLFILFYFFFFVLLPLTSFSLLFFVRSRISGDVAPVKRTSIQFVTECVVCIWMVSQTCYPFLRLFFLWFQKLNWIDSPMSETKSDKFSRIKWIFYTLEWMNECFESIVHQREVNFFPLVMIFTLKSIGHCCFIRT